MNARDPQNQTEATQFKVTRPPGSGNLEQHSMGNIFSGFAFKEC
jgi:hypothetical protein